MDQNKVIEKIKAGGEEELEKVYIKYRNEFLSWICRNYSCPLEDAKDIYQAVVIIFYESIVSGKLNELKSSIKTYLFAVGKNKYQEFMRSQGRETKFKAQLSSEDIVFDEADEARERELKCVEDCVDRLGDPCKTILHLYYYHKLSIHEITERLNYKNSDTLKNLKYKCLKRLKKIYDSEKETQNKI